MINIPFTDKYKKLSEFQYPQLETDPKKKDKEWALAISKSFLCHWLNDRLGIPYSLRFDYQTYRLYAKGRQPVVKYKDRLAPKDPTTGERKGYRNISWDNVSIIPKYQYIFLGMFDKLEHSIQATAIDDSSWDEREDEKWRTWARTQLEPRLGVMQAEGLQIKPRTVEELEMFFDTCYKLRREIAIEKFLEETFYLSNWKEIKTEVLKDFFTLGVGATKDYTDDGVIKVRYVDPANLLVTYTNKNTFDTISKVGEMVIYTLAQLRPLLRKAGYKDEDILKLVKTYQAELGNEYIDTNEIIIDRFQQNYYDNFRFVVLDSEVQTDDEVDSELVQMWYSQKWVLGTDMIFDNKPSNDIPRATSRKGKYKDVAKSSYHIYKISDKSPVANVVSLVDDLQLATLQMRNAVAQSRPKGLMIDIGVIENLTIGGKTVHPFEILKIAHEQGDLLYRGTTHHSQVLSPNSSRPVVELEGGLGNQLNEFIAYFNYHIQLIQQSLGMNPVSDGTNQNPNLLVGVAENLVASTNNALQPIYKGYVYTKEETAKNCSLRLQNLAKYQNLNAYKQSLGLLNITAIEAGKDISDAEYGIRLELKPTELEKEKMYQRIDIALKTPLEQGGITTADGFYVERLLKQGNYKYAQLWLGYKSDENRMKASQLQQENIQLQQQAAQQTEEAKIQGSIVQDEAKAKNEAMLENERVRLEKEKMALQHQYTMEEIALQNQGQVTGKQYTADMQHESQLVKSRAEIIKEGMKEEKKQAKEEK